MTEFPLRAALPARLCATALAISIPASLAPGQDPVTGTAPQAGYDGGFFVCSSDRRNELQIEGLFQFLGSAYSAERAPSSDFDVKRMRLEFTGKIDWMRAHLEPNFLPEGTEMEEAWIGFDLAGGNARVMLGRMKAPFGLEEVRSRRWIDFPRFSILNQFEPAEDHGVFLNGKTAAGTWEYGLAVYNGTGASDTNSSKDVAARAMWHPFAEDHGSALQNLQVGIAATAGRQMTDVGGDTISNELKLPVIELASGAELDGGRARAGLEAAWYRGPWFAQAELMRIEQEMSLGATEETISFQGGYLTISRVLTGESKSFGPLKPDSPVDPARGTGRGAWVLAARYSDLEVDDDLGSLGFAAPGTFTDRIRTFSLGLNWVLNEHAMVRSALVHTKYDDAVPLGDGIADDEDAVVIEFQLSF